MDDNELGRTRTEPDLILTLAEFDTKTDRLSDGQLIFDLNSGPPSHTAASAAHVKQNSDTFHPQTHKKKFTLSGICRSVL
jgi:hypothetical protein